MRDIFSDWAATPPGRKTFIHWLTDNYDKYSSSDLRHELTGWTNVEIVRKIKDLINKKEKEELIKLWIEE